MSFLSPSRVPVLEAWKGGIQTVSFKSDRAVQVPVTNHVITGEAPRKTYLLAQNKITTLPKGDLSRIQKLVARWQYNTDQTGVKAATQLQKKTHAHNLDTDWRFLMLAVALGSGVGGRAGPSCIWILSLELQFLSGSLHWTAQY